MEDDLSQQGTQKRHWLTLSIPGKEHSGDDRRFPLLRKIENRWFVGGLSPLKHLLNTFQMVARFPPLRFTRMRMEAALPVARLEREMVRL